jgi:murein DD-endopeptidase MepM/ murein hydrolase activator NlpD
MKHKLPLKSVVALMMTLALLASLSGPLGQRLLRLYASDTLQPSHIITHNAAPTPFLYRPYYGNQTISQRTTSFFDHDEPWYNYDGIFVRYDGARWTSNDSITTCTGGVNCYDGHNGYDLNLWFEPVLSAASGTVIRAGWYDPTNHESAFGLWAAVDHGNGYVNVYGHLSALEVYNGEQIGTQWPIGTSGTTGSSTGPHLHFGTYYLPQWYATDPFGWTGNYPDPNIVPDNYLWVSNPGSSYSAPDLSQNGSEVYPGSTMVDDGTSGWSSTGSWATATSSTDINGNLHYAATTNGSATATATWQPNLSASGYYEVGVFVDDNHASSSWAPYTIYSADPNNPNNQISHTVYVDESHIGTFQGPYGWENTGPQWIGLGVYYFNAAQNDRVILSNATGEDGLQISADGMEFAPVSGMGNPPSPTPTPTQLPSPTPSPTPPHTAYQEGFGPVQALSSLTPGETVKENVTIQNRSNFTWPAMGSDAVTLSYYWLDAQGKPVSAPIVGQSNVTTLPSNVAPGQTIGLSLMIHTPALAGSYRLVIDAQQQGQWFGALGATPLTLSIAVAPILPKTYYFAEGYTGTGTTEYLALTNPATSAATVTITYYYQGGAAPLARTYQLPALSHSVLNINQEAGANQSVSMIVQSTQPIAAERTMYTQKDSFSAAADSAGSSFLNSRWYFAEGNTTSGWNTLLSVLNPNNQAVTLSIAYLLNGQIVHGKASSFSVAARSRGTIILNNDLPNQQFGMIVTASAPVLVERPEYLTTGTYRGGSAVVGAPSPQSTWYFGGGNTTSGFREQLILTNPSFNAASAQIRYLTASGQTITQNVSVPGYTRMPVNVNNVVSAALHATAITASAPIIAERQDSFTTSFNGPIAGSTTVMGSSAPHNNWYITSGNTTTGHADYLAIGNLNNATAQVQVVYYLPSGAPIIKTYSIPANSRLTIDMSGDAGANTFGAALYSTIPIVTEQTAFFNANGSNGGYAAEGLGM